MCTPPALLLYCSLFSARFCEYFILGPEYAARATALELPLSLVPLSSRCFCICFCARVSTSSPSCQRQILRPFPPFRTSLCFAAYLACALCEVMLPQPVYGNLHFLIAFLLFHALPAAFLLSSATIFFASRRAMQLNWPQAQLPITFPITLAAGATLHFLLHWPQAQLCNSFTLAAGATLHFLLQDGQARRQQFSILSVDFLPDLGSPRVIKLKGGARVRKQQGSP